MRKVPKLRFKEFSDEWEENKLVEISDKIGDGIHSTPIYSENGNYYFINGNNIKDKKILYFIDTKRVNLEEYEKYKLNLNNNTILISINGTIGNLGYYNFEKIILGKSCGYITLKNIINKDFIYNYLMLNKIKIYFDKELTGTTIKNLSLKTLKNTLILLPGIQEQEKIANFLTSVDKKISLTEEKLELFREYKKGVMQKIFSQELRFKDSNGNDYPEWEEKRLGEIAFFSKGKLISKEDITEAGIECIRYGELYTTYKEKIEKIVSKTKLEKNKLILSEKNDVIIPSSGETAIDIAVASCVMKDGVALGADLNIIKTKENGLYLAYFINNPAKLELASLAQGASVIHLYEKHLKLLNIQLPILEEQQKIADFLSSIDNKIESIEKELEGLKEFKKGLLQQMFV